jgi:hypothetical protein
VLLAHYLSIIHRSQCQLGDAFDTVAEAHAADTEVAQTSRRLAAQCRRHADRLEPIARRYGEEAGDEPDDLHTDVFRGPRPGAFGVLRDLHDLFLMTAECDVVWKLIKQAAQGARDKELLAVVSECEGETMIQMKWCETQLQHHAPQVLVVAK